MTRLRVLLPVLACLMLAALAPGASAATKFRPRVKNGLGLVPPITMWGQAPDVASGALTPVVYHGGAVMAGGVTVHTIFWDGGVRPFQGTPAGAPTDYVGMVQRFFTDAAADSGTTGNVFSVLPQYAEGTAPGGITPGAYTINYNAGTDSIADHHPYPARADQCASPQNTAICITDAQIQQEVNTEINDIHGSRGLHDLWYVFLPPDVDECITAGVCGTNAFGGYHSVSDVGNGATIYALTIDPLIETRRANNPGDDPQGYPDAELTTDIAAHETVEAMTDPEGIGYMDPNGFETADKCEFGPQYGDPTGFAANGSPFNQTINGHHWLIQEMWANHDNTNQSNCVQSTTNTNNDLPLPQVNLTQYSGTITGNTEKNIPGTSVHVSLLRANAAGSPVTVATGSTTTAADGTWTVLLSGGHVVGDDRDEIHVTYSGAGAPSPATEIIQTGNGGNPFLESGWTGWTALDQGSALLTSPSPSLSLSPCFQTGVFSAAGTPTLAAAKPNDECNTQTGIATVGSGAVSKATKVTYSTQDNRAFVPDDLPAPYSANTVGALVKLTAPVGEPNAVSPFVSPMEFFTPTGLPSCTANLQGQMVTCDGLVAGASYTVTDGSRHVASAADGSGTVSVSLPVKGGDLVSLSNGSRTLTVLHVANLRVDITGEQTVLFRGSCQPFEYYAPPLTTAPTNASAGVPSALAGGAGLTDQICPASGFAGGLSATNITQTDEFSGGQTTTQVPDVEDTSPMNAETVYGTFTALASSGFPGPNNSVTPDTTSRVKLMIRKASSGAVVFTANNVDTANGVAVKKLKPGTYQAAWTLTDASGDTRKVTTRFIEQSALQGPPGPRGKRGPQGKRGPAGPKPHVSCKLQRHNKIKCKVTFKKASDVKGTLRMKFTRNGQVAALGHSRLSHGQATVTLRELQTVSRGEWSLTLVVNSSGKDKTTRMTVSIS